MHPRRLLRNIDISREFITKELDRFAFDEEERITRETILSILDTAEAEAKKDLAKAS